MTTINKEEARPIVCEVPGCFIKNPESIYVGIDPKTEEPLWTCYMHCRSTWSQYRERLSQKLRPAAQVKVTGSSFLNQKRLTGVQIKYVTHQSEPTVPSIWTPTRVYPYPNHRHKHGLRGSYTLEEVEIVSWGKHEAPK